MKKKELNNLKTKTVKDLLKMLSQKKVESAKKVMEISGGKEKNLKAAGNLRREVAQIMTILKEKEIIEMIEKTKEAGK